MAFIPEHTYKIDGKVYAVYIGDRVSLAHQSLVHGPAWIEDDCFIGFQALVFQSHIGKGSYVEPGAKVIGVEVPANHYVPAGMTLTNQSEANKLPKIDPEVFSLYGLNEAVVEVNTALAKAWQKLTGISFLTGQR